MAEFFGFNDATPASGSPTDTCSGCTSYGSSFAVYNIFGTKNVNLWADLDNEGDADTIAGRIAWALCLATSTIDSRLLGGIYGIPFIAPVPCVVQDACARLAGCLLYDARRIADNSRGDDESPTYETQPHRNYVMQFLRNIRGGKIRLPGVAQVGTTVPIGDALTVFNSVTPEGWNPGAAIYLPFIWRPVVLYPPPCSIWPGDGTLLNWLGY